MNQLTTHILFFLFISIAGYSQNTDTRYITEPTAERFFPKLNDINKVKYVKTVYYEIDPKGNFLGYSLDTEIYIDEYPYKYFYEIDTKTNDTISKIIYKYYEDKNTLEYVIEDKNPTNGKIMLKPENTTRWYYDKKGNIIKKIESVNTESQITNRHFNSKNLLIREESVYFNNDKSFIHYLYNDTYQLVKKIRFYNQNIDYIISWAYKEDNTYYVTEQLVYNRENVEYKPRHPIKTENTRSIKKTDEKIKYTYDKHNNWIKETYMDDEGYSIITEREIIYK